MKLLNCPKCKTQPTFFKFNGPFKMTIAMCLTCDLKTRGYSKKSDANKAWIIAVKNLERKNDQA